MGREGWIYAIAFLAILGVGGLIIVPRLQGTTDEEPPAWEEPRRRPVEPRRDPSVESFEGAVVDWVTVTVSGERGGLRGPFRPVEGAQVEAETKPEARHQTLRLRPDADTVYFGALGHRWVGVPAATLQDGMRIALPAAAKPLVVRVRELDGRPAADVPVRVLPPAPGDQPRTDDGGTLILDWLPPGLVTVDLSTTERAGPRLRLRAGVDRDVRVTLDPVWTVTGRVLTPAGSPIAGARIEAFGPRGGLGRVVNSLRDGRFTWRGPATTRLGVRVHATGWSEMAVEVSPPATAPLATNAGDIRLQRGGVTLDGVVESEFREPDAHVVVEPAVAAIVREIFGTGLVLDKPRRVPLQDDGRFRFYDLPSNLPLRISVRGAGVPVDVIADGTAGEDVPVRLEPPRGETLAGVLRGPDGEPAVGVRLLVSAEPRDGNAEVQGDLVVHAGPDGSFRLRGLAGRTWYVRGYAPGRRSLLKQVVLPLSAPLELAFEAALTGAERRVAGRVLDAQKRGLVGVTVRAAGVMSTTDETGAFTLDGVESVAPTVTLSYAFEPGPLPETAVDPRPFVAFASTTTEPGARDLELILPVTSQLRFRALDGIDDRPLAFVHVLLRSDEGEVLVDRGIAPRDGVVELDGLPPRGFELAVMSHDRRFLRKAIQLRPLKTTDLGDVLLTHGMRIEGRITTKTGDGVPGALVGAYGRGWQHVGRNPAEEVELLFRTARADERGFFMIEGFDRRASANLAVWAPGFAPTTAQVALPKGTAEVVAEVTVKVEPGGYLGLDLHETGDARGPGPAIHGALIDLEYARDGSDFLDLVLRGMLGGLLGSSEEWTIASEQLLPEQRGADGYILGPLRPGPYELWVVRPGYARLRRRLTIIDPTQSVMVDIMSGQTSERFAGRVTRLRFEMDPDR